MSIGSYMAESDLLDRMNKLLCSTVGSQVDEMYTYCCFDSSYSNVNGFFVIDGLIYLLERYFNENLSSYDMINFFFKALESVAMYRSIFMEHREEDEELPSEIYLVYDTRTKISQYCFNYKPVFNAGMAEAHFRAWYIACGGEPLPEWKAKPLARIRNWLNRDDAFSWIPSIKDVLADPPWGNLSASESISTEIDRFSGWDAIIDEFARLYPGQVGKQLSSNFPTYKYVQSYDSGDSIHFVTMGLSELFEKTGDDMSISGLGLELTLRLGKRGDWEREAEETANMLHELMMDILAKGKAPRCYKYITPEHISTCAAGFLTVPDTRAQELDTPNGRVRFVELVGITGRELEALKNMELTVPELYDRLGSDITDYSRPSAI